MVNDTSTVAGALQECIDHLEDNLAAKGVTASYAPSTGMIGLIDEILNIPTGGSCYHIELDDSAYTTTGSLTVSATVLKNYATCVGETVTFTGGTSTVTATTNSNGVATATVTFSASGTLTASIGGATDTATVTVQQGHLFYDDCSSATGLSNYGTIHELRVQNADGTLSYDSTMNAYKFTPTVTDADGFVAIPIPALDNENGYYVEAEFYTKDSTTGGQSGLTLYPVSDTGGNGVFFRDIASINRCGVLRFTNYSYGEESGNSQQSSLPVYNHWYKLKLEIDGTSVIAKWCQTDDTLVYSTNYTVPYTASQMRIGLTFLAKTQSTPYYVRNIKAEYI